MGPVGEGNGRVGTSKVNGGDQRSSNHSSDAGAVGIDGLHPGPTGSTPRGLPEHPSKAGPWTLGTPRASSLCCSSAVRYSC